MSSKQENSLAQAASAYLRSARHQPIQWHEWGAEAFAKAQREDKPVLLDIGAVWCHWCHVMDRESYENVQTAQIINDLFIAIKVDRDERPDVDVRYQAAVSAISAQSGWPLTAFLTPDGKPYFGGTYFPPDDRYGRPGFPRVLLTMAEAFQKQRGDVNESADGVLETLQQNETFFVASEESQEILLGKLIETAVKQFDGRNGGFGAQPKFPHSGVIDLLIDAASRPGSSPEVAARVGRIAMVTLEKMAAGGIYDQLAGGFHRYSVDERWIVPHFEKMSYDNSELLKNYVHAFQTFMHPEFARIAKDIIRWIDEVLSDRERGGFYASQDADDSLDDDGDYFTWTRAEAAAVLSSEEFKVAAAYYNLRDVGDMHHNPAKNVLHVVAAAAESIAKTMGVTEQDVAALHDAAKQKMYAARLGRRTPYVDKTIYTGWNGMCISAYLEAAHVLHLPDVQEFALKSLDRILQAAWQSDLGLAHVVAYGEEAPAVARIAGVMEDYAFLANALLDAWESTGALRYFDTAKTIVDAMLDRFYDQAGGGFFDIESPGADAIGVMSVRRKPIQDTPTPSGNAVAASVLLRLHALTGKGNYEIYARQTIATFAGTAEHFGLYAANYALSLRRATSPPVQVCVVGSDTAGQEMRAAALAGYAVNKSVVLLTREQFGELPPALTETLPHAPAMGGSYAVVCRGNTCLPPIANADDLAEVLV